MQYSAANTSNDNTHPTTTTNNHTIVFHRLRQGPETKTAQHNTMQYNALQYKQTSKRTNNVTKQLANQLTKLNQTTLN